jgi:CRISPR-associated protein Csh2
MNQFNNLTVKGTALANYARRSQFIFVYDSTDCIPNGDPFTGEQRYDEATSRVLISDVRIKRNIRDFLIEMNVLLKDKDQKEIYMQTIDKNLLDEKDKKTGTGSSARLRILANKYPELSVGGKFDTASSLLKFFDVVLFGGIATLDKDATGPKGKFTANAQFTGPVQISNLNASLNKVVLRKHQNTSHFQSDMDNEQGAIGTTSLVPYSLNQILGSIDNFKAVKTGLTENQVLLMLDALWSSLSSSVCETRSKNDQNSRLLIKINLTSPVAKISDLREKIKIVDPNNTDYRKISDITWDFSGLAALVASDKIDSVQYRTDDSIASIFTDQMKAVASKLIPL